MSTSRKVSRVVVEFARVLQGALCILLDSPLVTSGGVVPLQLPRFGAGDTAEVAKGLLQGFRFCSWAIPRLGYCVSGLRSMEENMEKRSLAFLGRAHG